MTSRGSAKIVSCAAGDDRRVRLWLPVMSCDISRSRRRGRNDKARALHRGRRTFSRPERNGRGGDLPLETGLRRDSWRLSPVRARALRGTTDANRRRKLAVPKTTTPQYRRRRRRERRRQRRRRRLGEAVLPALHGRVPGPHGGAAAGATARRRLATLTPRRARVALAATSLPRTKAGVATDDGASPPVRGHEFLVLVLGRRRRCLPSACRGVVIARSGRGLAPTPPLDSRRPPSQSP